MWTMFLAAFISICVTVVRARTRSIAAGWFNSTYQFGICLLLSPVQNSYSFFLYYWTILPARYVWQFYKFTHSSLHLLLFGFSFLSSLHGQYWCDRSKFGRALTNSTIFIIRVNGFCFGRFSFICFSSSWVFQCRFFGSQCWPRSVFVPILNNII